MAINWYPGHMHKARKEIRELMPQVDLIIEVLDARIPFSSENPLVPSLRKDTPCIKILNKADLADPVATRQWQQAMEKEQGIRAIPMTQHEPQKVRELLNICPQMLPHRNFEGTPLRALILGIPNVGKSTTINNLANRIIAKTGNEPAVTKAQQRIKLPNNIVLHDTPGFLWPKLEPEECGYRLAVTGAIKNTVLEFEDVGMFLVEYLMEAHPDILRKRYNLDEIPMSAIEIFDDIGRRRGCMRKGGFADTHKVAEILINDFRSGALGRLTLETPEMIEAQKIIMEARRAEEEEKKAEKTTKKKKSRSKA
ncbi:ribosome biogenesis GTPase YlqF [Sansalvadorimonas sp. 2012CJ34-2]|uniref:Ribosome biogenesis GTPase A n=1 Tax=Parendozoicomonas callyspongiae TaxID=2942213 RepID=A0ABT0PD03_9GAMM|nr:ribosome biogenesis GTPase YlqF [Sansalvadorimonas sp. 2012CJ34-2]MCL6269183.1 ribosome biogenesis GTPase YlqF [Sansalvadorimonas sp. 2012CJ34-2]